MIILFFYLSILVLSYLIGNLNFSILISKFYFKKEIRILGSENAGTTNMLRVFGKKVGAITFLGDFLKGSFCVFMVNFLFPIILKLNTETNAFFINSKIEFQTLALFGVVLGHIFPAFFNFKGGKGIATAAGAILLIDFKIFLILIVVFLTILVISKIVSLSSILTTTFYAVLNATYWFINLKVNNFGFSSISFQIWILITIKSTILSSIILLKHSKNIKRIIKKSEPKIGR